MLHMLVSHGRMSAGQLTVGGAICSIVGKARDGLAVRVLQVAALAHDSLFLVSRQSHLEEAGGKLTDLCEARWRCRGARGFRWSS